MENRSCICRDHSFGFDHLLYLRVNRNMFATIGYAIWKRKVNPIGIVIAAFIYLINKLFLIRHVSGFFGYFCRCHLNDLVCPLFFLGVSQIMLIWAEHEIHSYKFCVLLGMAAGFIWEYFAPLINANAVSDPIDLLCYFVGINIYYLGVKRDQE